MRIRWRALAVVLLISALVLTACGSRPQSGTGQSPTNQLVIADDISDIVSLDPAVAYEFGSVFVAHQLYDTLVTFAGSDTEKVVGELAESWEVSDDWTTFTFRLRQGAKFHSGREVTAEAVAFSFDRVVKLNQAPAWLFTDFGLTEGSTKALDQYTVEIKLSKPVNPDVFLSILTFPVAAVVDPEEVRAREQGGDLARAYLHDHDAGSGPYILEEWSPEQQVVLKANPDYWGGKPALDRVVIRHVGEATTQKLMLERGDVDIAANLTPEMVQELRGKEGLQVVDGLTLYITYLGMNVAAEPFDDNRVREAVRYAIDVDGIVNQVLSGNAIAATSIIPKGVRGHSDERLYRRDVAKARALLQEAGLGDGFTVNALVPTGMAVGGVPWSDIAAKVKSDLAEVGINLELQELTSAALLEQYRAQDHQMVFMNWGPDFADPDANATPFGNGRVHQLAWRNSWVDDHAADLTERALHEKDPQRRVQLYQELNRYVLQNGPFALMYQPKASYVMKADIQGFAYNPFWTVELAGLSR